MAKRLLIILLTVFSFSFLQSCGGDDFDVFQKKVKDFGSDSIISQEEWNELAEYIDLHSSDRKFNRFFTEGVFDNQKLENYISNLGFTIEEEETDDPSE